MGFKLGLPQPLSSADSPTFTGVTLSGLTAGRVPYVGASDELADSANMRFDATTPNAAFRFRLENETTAQSGITTTHHTARIIMKATGASQIDGVRRALYVQADDDTGSVNKTITGAANNGSGLVRITATAHGFTTGDGIGVYGVTGTTEANGVWVATVITADTFDLQGSTFTNAYVSGGTATNRSSLVGIHVLLQPTLSRTNAGVGTNIFNDDLNGLTIQSSGSGKATDAVYIAGNPAIVGAPAWVNAFATDANSNFFFRAIGKAYTAGIDLASATYDTGVPAIRLGAAADVQLDTATGTKIGTATSQKLAFFNSTPIVQPSNTTDLRAALINLGLYATGGASPLDLNGGLLTAGSGVVSGALTVDTDTLVVDATNNRVGMGTTAPATRLHIASEAANNNPINAIYVAATSGASWTSQKFRGTLAAPRRALADDVLGGMVAQGGQAADDSSTAAASNSGGQFRFFAGENFTSSAVGSYFTLGLSSLGTTTQANRLMVAAGKALTDGAATDILSCTIGSGTVIGGVITYTIEATDGTDYQVETGQVVWSGVNKGGTVTATVTEVNSQQSVSAGTLTTAWAISAASPAVISVNANTSLSPSAGFPRITFNVDNNARQTVAFA